MVSENEKPLSLLTLSLTTIALLLLLLNPPSNAQSLPPPRYDGFVYDKNVRVNSDTIRIEAFLDPVCPDSRDAWAPLTQAVHYYGSHVQLVVHLLPLPYHDNAYVTSRALHIVNALNTSATFHLLELFFKEQERFYNAQTFDMSKASIVSSVANFAIQAVGNSYSSAIEAGFNNRLTDLLTRVSFKYSTSSGVYGTPTFFVNGFSLPDAGSSVDFKGWRSIIDPLIAAQGNGKEESAAAWLGLILQPVLVLSLLLIEPYSLIWC